MSIGTHLFCLFLEKGASMVDDERCGQKPNWHIDQFSHIEKRGMIARQP